jgi:hypothetical protein
MYVSTSHCMYDVPTLCSVCVGVISATPLSAMSALSSLSFRVVCCRFVSFRCPNLYPCPSLLVVGLQFPLQLLEFSSHAVLSQSRPVLRSRPLYWTQAIDTPEGRSGLYRNSPRTVRRWRSSVVGGCVGPFAHRVAPTDASTQIRQQCIIPAFKGLSQHNVAPIRRRTDS